MKIKLKHCPYCLNKPTVRSAADKNEQYWVVNCLRCNLETAKLPDLVEAMEAWNEGLINVGDSENTKS